MALAVAGPAQDQPPSLQRGPMGFEPRDQSYFDAAEDHANERLDSGTAENLARETYDASTQWLNSGRRAKWSDALRAFNNQHPSGSKYLSRDYAYRSRLYRPKSRAIVRKAEEHTATAFFSNEDVVSIQPQDDDNPQEKASAELMQALLQYRLTKSPDAGGIPWFQTLVGARQDAEVMGVAIAKVYWKHEERFARYEVRPQTDPETGETFNQRGAVMKVVDDKPVIDLIAPENFRFEPGADWRDPVGSSPYLIHLVPMYVREVRNKIDKGEWLPISESALRGATDLQDDVTRRAREQGRVPGKDHDVFKPREFDVCWAREYIVRWFGRDWHFWAIGDACALLTEPRPIEEVYLHGLRPYVLGSVVLETHKSYPIGKVELIRELQQAANETWNLRFDNVKQALNPRQLVRAGLGIDTDDMRKFMPGKVVLVPGKAGTPLEQDIVWDRPPEVTESAYAEQDRINLDVDELTGGFTNSSVEASQIQQQSATGMHLMSGSASGMNEYELRMFAETFVEPVLRLLIKLEQAYETDPVILALAGKNAQLIQKYGIDQITDELLDREMTVRANVGIGATNPSMRLKNFMIGSQILGNVFGPTAAMGANFEEVSKEVFGLLGYKDGSRFFKPDFDPRVAMMQQEMAKHTSGQADMQKVQAQQQMHAADIQLKGQMHMQELAIQARTDQAKLTAELQKAQQEQAAAYQKTLLQEQGENWRTMFQANMEATKLGMQSPNPDDVTKAANTLNQIGEMIQGLHHGQAQIAQGIGAAHQQTQQELQRHGKVHEAAFNALKEIHDERSQPRQVEYGPDGKPAAIKHGSKTYRLNRDQSGRVVGLG